MRLCMFCPLNHPMKRGWVGRVEGDQVIHLAAQTLQAFFTGGGAAREHAVYPLDGVALLAPVLHPPSIRAFEDKNTFEFANPAAIVRPQATLSGNLAVLPRLAALIGADEEIGGFTALAEWRDPLRSPPKDRDFALALGPVVVTLDELAPDGLSASVRVDGKERGNALFEGFDWAAARDIAADRTVLRPGDLLAGPAAGRVDDIRPGSTVELDVERVGVLGPIVLRD